MIAKKIVGLQEIKDLVEQNVASKDSMIRCHRPPNHIIFSGLKSGNGRTMITNLITDFFYENNLRIFSALDYSLEFKTDGKIENINKILSDIETASVFTSNFEGVIGLDIDALIDHPNEAQTTLLIDELEHMGQYATILIYVDSTKRNAHILIEKIVSALRNVDVIDIEPYTVENLTEITKLMITENHNVKVNDDVSDIISALITDRNITTAKECKYLANKLVRFANCSYATPVLSATELKKEKTI